MSQEEAEFLKAQAERELRTVNSLIRTMIRKHMRDVEGGARE